MEDNEINRDVQKIQIREKVVSALMALRPLPGRDFDVEVNVTEIMGNGSVKTGFAFKAYNEYGSRFLEYAVPVVQELLKEASDGDSNKSE